MSFTPPHPGPAEPPRIERRRRKRGHLDRMIDAPLQLPAIDVRAWALRLSAALLASALVLGLGMFGYSAWSRRPRVLAPRHRPEALCFALASAPSFAPPMRVEPSAALVRGRFALTTPAAVALRQTMHFTDDLVIWERVQRIGDFDVASVWLHVPGQEAGHWLIVGWMEGTDLAVCTFAFDRPPAESNPSAATSELSPEEATWGNQLLGRVLRPENFRAEVLPSAQLRVTGDRSLPAFGPTD